MKKLNKYLKTLALIVLVIFSSCDSFDLDLTENPNFLTPSQADVDFFLSSIQEDFVRQIEGDADYDANDNWQSGGVTQGDGLSLFGADNHLFFLSILLFDLLVLFLCLVLHIDMVLL